MPLLNGEIGRRWLLAPLMGIVTSAGAVESDRATRPLLRAEAAACQAFDAGNAGACGAR